MRMSAVVGLAMSLVASRLGAAEIYLDELDLSNVTSGESVYWPQAKRGQTALTPETTRPKKNANVFGEPLALGTNAYARGVGVLANSVACIETGGKALSFAATVGADPALGKVPYKWVPVGLVEVWADEKLAFSKRFSGPSAPMKVNADVRGAKRVYLATYFSGYQTMNPVNWCEARFAVEEGARLRTVRLPAARQLGILTPPEKPEPRINGPAVFGVRPGHPILYTLPVTGERPMTLAASGLPEGATFDAKTGFLRGAVARAGSYPIVFTARNAKGVDVRTVRLRVGDRIALTPPMCWNSWNCFGGRVTGEDIRKAADAFVSQGLVNHGWSYVNIDDFWMQSPEKGRKNFGPGRDAQGELLPADTFGDMKALADYIHARGLRAGLYSSPGPTTCGRCYGSWQHEVQDATTFAKWGYDFLKYDRCSLFAADDKSLPRTVRQQRPYRLMADALKAQNRDIVLDICQYGECSVWAWGRAVGGHMWRTTGDISDAWASCLGIIDAQIPLVRHTKPDGWNDPDMMVVGCVGGGAARPARLTQNEQYTHVGLWAMMSAPLQIGCDLTKLDPFTRSLLTNDEILEIDLDELGRAADCVEHDDAGDVWVKPLSDGSVAVACFNRFFLERDFRLPLLRFGIQEDWRVRCVWAQKDLGVTRHGAWTWTVKAVPPHATMILRFYPPKTWETSVASAADCPDCPKIAPAVADIDFGAVSTNVIRRSGVGRLEGVLPAEVADNFTGWAKASVKTTALCEREGCFLRFETSPGASGGQFSVRLAEPLETGHYRMEVEARNCRRTRSRPLRFLARLGPPSWKALWSAEFGGRDWRRETSAFFIDAKDGRPELFLQTQPGTVVDIRHLRLTRITPQDYRAVHVPNAPSDDRRHFVRHTRFPLGLPSGWNTGRDGVFVETSAGRSDDGLPTFRFVSARTNACFYSEPFLTSATGGVATVRIRYRAQGTWHASAFADVSYRWVGSAKLPASEAWREASFRITEPPDAEALSVKIAGCGSFELDRFDVTKGTADQPPDGDHVAEVTLQVSEGEVASSRLQFADEPARLAWAVTDAPKGAELRLSVGDLYGRRRDLAPVALKGGRLETGTLAYLPETAAEVGQYRVDAEVFVGGVRVSPREELVVTRIRRPVYWKRTAPNSPFGTHLIARQDTLTAAKAAGVNWTRFHDAGTEYSGWYDLEREKGVWTFHDEEIERFRRAGILMYAQLGTAPLWATHFPETKFAKTPRNYFAKYLRPTNMVDYLAYVTKFVTRYRGVIDDYFIWNEPWGRWWVTAEDARFFSTNRAELVRQYGRFSNATYAAAKAANPNARISGFNATGGQVDWWMEPLAEVGVMDACDDIDFHFYTPNARLSRPDDEPLSAGPLAPLRKRWPDLRGKRVIMSEGQGVSTGSGGVTGRMTGLYRTIFAFEPESHESCASMADQTCRYNLDLLSEGVSRIFVYTTHSYETMAVKPRFQSFFGADGYPHPELVAHAHMARLIEDRAFVDKTAYGAQGVRLRFRSKDGTEVEAYTELSRQEAAELVRRHPDACTDLWGNPLDVAVWPEGTLVYRMISR